MGKIYLSKFLLSLIAFCLLSTSISILDSDSLFTKPYKDLEPVNIRNLTEFEYDESLFNYDEDLQEYIKEIEQEGRRLKLASCLLLIRNLLATTPNKVSDTVKNSKLNKELTFNKIYAEMLNFCVTSIETETCDKILEDTNLGMVDELSVNKYLKFESKKFLIIGPEPKLSYEENAVMSEVEALSASIELFNPVINNSEDFVTSEFSFLKGRGYYVSIGILSGIAVTVAWIYNRK